MVVVRSARLIHMRASCRPAERSAKSHAVVSDAGYVGRYRALRLYQSSQASTAGNREAKRGRGYKARNEGVERNEAIIRARELPLAPIEAGSRLVKFSARYGRSPNGHSKTIRDDDPFGTGAMDAVRQFE